MDEFNKIWSSYFFKKNAILLKNGKEAIIQSLLALGSKKVALPTYTCHRVLQACIEVGAIPYIIDCGLDLQININKIPKEIDTVIVPHMFGIKANIEPLKGKVKIIEDCSQCIGLPDLGKHSDIVIASTGPTKWLNAGESKEEGGGIMAFDGSYNNFVFNPLIAKKLNNIYFNIKQTLESRTNKANELINAGIDLIGKDQPNAWLRALYFGSQKRVPYTPLHDIYPGFKCPVVDSYKNKIDWISIFP
jgi:hypothetical protein